MAASQRTELIFSLAGGGALLTGFILSRFDAAPSLTVIALYTASYFFGAYFMLFDLFGALRKGVFDIDLLMFLAALGAALIGRWAEGALLLFLFSLGHSLEHYALDRANRSIAALAKLAPKTALVKRDGRVEEVAVELLRIGDIAVVRPNSQIAADGLVIAGESMVDQSSLTGESMPVLKRPGPDPGAHLLPEKDAEIHRVYAGTTNGPGYLEVRVLKPASETSLSRLIRMVKEARENKSYAQNLTQKFETYYVPSVLAVVALLNFAFLVIDEPFQTSFYRAITLLVVASPCALVISTPSAVLCGIARAAHAGVLFKGGKPLLDLGAVDAMVFDKTGTLTSGQPVVTDFVSSDASDHRPLLAAVVALEERSDHPLARALVRDLRIQLDSHPLPEVRDSHSVIGCGIRGTVGERQLWVGNTELFAGAPGGSIPAAMLDRMRQLESEGKTTVLVREESEFKALIGIMDVPRKENRQVIESLRNLGMKRIVMLSGDNQLVADAVGGRLGITEVHGNLHPGEKLEFIRRLIREKRLVAMIGDGVNDAPALAGSTVGISMGAAGSDLARESSDVALMADRLEQLPTAVRLSRKTRRIVRQNLIISIGVIFFMIPVALLGLTSIGPAVLIHEGSTVAVVLNALRLLK
jgi:Zn2+/Cd2+-exporting ATPase